MSDFDVDSDEDYDDDPPLRNLKKKTQKNSRKSSNKENTSTKKSKLKKQVLEEKSKQRKSSSARPDPAPSSNTSSLKRKTSNSQSSAVSSPKKKRKIETNGSSDKGSAIKSKSNAAALKEKDKSERLSYAMQSFLWWDAKEPPDGCQWVTMEHAGVSFPDPYEPHGVKLLYDGKPVDLTVAQEEAATFLAAMDPEGMHLGNPKTAKIFIKNFFEDFKELLGRKHVIKDFSKCDFEPIRTFLNEQKIIRKALTDEEKKTNKSNRDKTLLRYGFAVVDGHLERVGNYNMEPPGTFRGRGEHPKMGKLKSRVMPEQVQLNVSECAPVPRCSVPGHAWGEICHDPHVQWLVQWKENINNQVKYMQLAAQSSFKGKSDRKKYNKAALLCENIVKIRAATRKALRSSDAEERQLATAVWVIDRLALRVGGEKDTDEEADTVGCCSLRVEHMHFDPNEEGGENYEIELEFLGKDSMLYKQTIDFGSEIYVENNGMGKQVWENFKRFCRGKAKTDEIFDKINPTILNQHLKQFMDGLTAKVFRTYNASRTLQDELMKVEKLSSWKALTPAEKVVEYNNANREVAILCNHQRSVSKAQETQLEVIGSKLATLQKQKKQLKKILQMLGKDEMDKIPLKKSEKEMTEQANEAIAKAKELKENAKTNAEKIAATEEDEKAKKLKREVNDAKFTKAHLWEKCPSKDQVIKRIAVWSGKISKMEMDLKHKDDNKEVSLGTSKINYMDPRISVAWCKRNEVPIEKIFSKTLRDKFNWAMAVPPDWMFEAKVGKE